MNEVTKEFSMPEADSGKHAELGPAEPPKGGEWLGNIPTDPSDPRFPEGLETVARLREENPGSTILVTKISRDPSTGGYATKRGVLGIWKFEPKDSPK